MLNIRRIFLLLFITAFVGSVSFAQNCITSSTYTMNPAPVNGQYQAGQTVQICATFTFSQAGAIWTHGIIPVIPAGWDLSTIQISPPASCSGSGVWGWYNSVTGTAGTAGTNGPGMFYNQGGDNNPGNNFGDNCLGSFSFCITLTTSADCGGGALNGSNLNIQFQVTGDNLSGSWTSGSCGVSTINTPAAFNSTLNCCTSEDIAVTLCDPGPASALNSFLTSPTPGGTWSDPAGNPSNGTFTPGVSIEGLYSYNVNVPGCISTSTADITIQPAPSAGVGSNTSICNSSPPFDLNDLLANEDLGGSWTGPGNVIVSNTFTPGTSVGGNYTYSVGDGTICPLDQESVTVTVIPLPNAGIDGQINVCESESAFDLFDILTGNPDAGGTWTDSQGNNYAGTFTPGVSSDDVFTYSVGVDPCISTATLDVVTITLPFAGNDVITEVCADSAPVNLFDLLVGANAGGSWIDPLGNVSTGILNPGVDVAGSYTYSLGSGACFDEAVVDVSIITPPEITLNGPSEICENEIFDITFDILGNGPFNVLYSINGTEYSLNNINSGHIESITLDITSTIEIISVESTIGAACIGIGNSLVITVTPIPTASISGGGGICAGASSELTFNFTGTGPFDVTYSDGNQNYTLNGINDGHVVSVSPSTNITYTLISMSDNSILQCNGTVSGNADFIITDAPEANISGDADICLGESTNLTFTISGTGPFDVTYTNGIDNISLFDISSGHIESVSPNSSATYELVSVAISSNSSCTGTVSGSAQISVFTGPTINNLDINCTATNENYIVTFEIIGGNPLNYNVSGPGTLTGNSFVSNPINNGAIYNFTISDGGVCPTEIVTGSFLCDCTSDAGSLQADLLEICGNSSADVTPNNDAVLDGNDIISYVIHDGSNISLGNILSASSTPSLSFQAGMTYGTTYYISAIVGNNNGANIVDVNDPCLSVSIGIPVVFNQPPLATITGNLSICEGQSGSLSITLTGDSPWTFDYAINGVPQGAINTNTQPYLLDVATSGTYTLVAASDANCIGTLAGTAIVSINELPTAAISGGGNICENSNDGPQIVLTGIGPWNINYTIDSGLPINQEINSTPFTLPAIASGTYQLASVSDASCTGTVDGEAIVNLQPLPTVSITGGGNICSGMEGEFELSGMGSGVVTVNYAIDGIATGSIELENGNASFISNVAGIYTILSVEDDFCINTNENSQSVLTVTPLPTANLNVNPLVLCEGDSALINIDFTGNGPFDLIYSIGDEIIEYQNINSLNEYLIPNNGQEILLISLADNSNPTCAQALDQSAVFSVSPRPQSPNLEDIERCMFDEFTNIGVPSVSGLNYTWTPSIGLSNPNISNPEFQLITNSSIVQSYNYTLNIDNGICSAQTNMTITVDPGPIVGFNYTPNPVTTISTSVNFYNTTPGINDYLWVVDSSSTFSTYNINYTFPDEIEGSYPVSLTATDIITGCQRTANQTINIKGELTVYVPNAFTPNGDGINDLFGPVMLNYSEEDYSFVVINRQGEIVFSTENTNQKWTGEAPEKEYYTQDDVYQWLLKVKDKNTVQIFSFEGTVTVLR